MRLAVFNLKGGVGKTTVVCNVAAALAKMGKKVLVVDLDPQSNASHYLLGEQQPEQTIAAFFEATLGLGLFKPSLKEYISPTPYPNLFMIAGSESLTPLQSRLEAKHKIYKLKQALDVFSGTEKFDVVLFDTPPALNFYSISALIAADQVVIPFDCDLFSSKGVDRVMEAVAELKDDHNLSLSVQGVVINNFQHGAKLPSESVEDLTSRGYHVIEPIISSSIIIKESHQKGTPLAFLRPEHKIGLQFAELAQNLVRSKSEKLPKRRREHAPERIEHRAD